MALMLCDYLRPACYIWHIRHFSFFNLIILFWLIQQDYFYDVTGQSQESKRSYKPSRIKELHSKLHCLRTLLCTLTATHLTLIYVCTYIRLRVPSGCPIKQARIIISYPYNPKFIENTWDGTRDRRLDSCIQSIASALAPAHFLFALLFQNLATFN